mgnify:CR=1 FL=1
MTGHIGEKPNKSAGKNPNSQKPTWKNKPIEKHDTAAWARIKNVNPISGVTIPGDFNMEMAKEYVDENQK